jgi:HlyD family secretion protein
VASEQDLDRAGLQRDEGAARLRDAEAQLDAARKRLADLSLASPVDGVLDQLPFDPGERVPAGAVLAIVLGDAEPWVRVWIPEESFVRVLPGTPAEVRIDGIEGPLRGSVLDVSRDPEFTPHYALTERDRVHLVYETRVRILDAPPQLRPGVPARVHILAPSHVATAAP